MAWKSRFTTIAAGTAPAIDRATHRTADYIRDLAVQLAPEDSGDLKRSGHLDKEAPDGSLEYQVIFDMPYSAAVEYGRSDLPAYPAQPFLTPATRQISLVKEIRAELRALLRNGR